MNNAEVASALDEVAQLLELKQESGFRIRAYQNAARAIETLGETVEAVADRGELTDIRGVGAGIAERITELLKSGHMQYLDDLRGQFPPGVTHMLDVPGVGPSLARRVYEELGVTSVDELREAASDGRLAGLSGLGEKSAHNVLRGLERVNKRDDRISIGRAVPLVEEIIERMQGVELSHLTAAGSLRRWSPTIGDIDLMAASDQPDEIMQRFVDLPQVRQVLAHGSTKSAVVVAGGLQVDLRLVPAESFGALLQHFTGSKAHNVELREYALRRGVSLNEYGILDTASGRRQTYSDEAEFYRALGLEYIEPELREAHGEIQAAADKTLPKLVRVEDIRGDLHVHSDWSDGAFPIEHMVREARGRGYQYMALTDHSGGIGVAGGLQPDRLVAQLDVVASLNAQLDDFVVFTGSEVDIRRDGSLDFPDELLARLDWVIASVHSGFNQSREDMTKRVLAAVRNPHVDAIAHPTGRLIGKREPYDVDLEQVFRAAAQTGTALEINSFPERLDLDDVYARRARELGVTLVINTDAHAPDHYDNIRYGVAMARRAWARQSDVLNCLSVDRLRELIRSDGR